MSDASRCVIGGCSCSVDPDQLASFKSRLAVLQEVQQQHGEEHLVIAAVLVMIL